MNRTKTVISEIAVMLGFAAAGLCLVTCGKKSEAPDPDASATRPPAAPASHPEPSPQEQAVLQAKALVTFQQLLEKAEVPVGLAEFETCLAGASEEILSQMLAVLEATPGGPTKAFAITAVFSRWAEIAPEVALENAQAHGDKALRSYALNGALGGWVRQDPDAALLFIDTFGSDQDRAQMGVNAISLLAKSDPKTAANLSLAAAEPRDRRSRLSIVARLWVNSDPGAAFEYVDDIEDVNLRSFFVQTASREFARKEPSAAIDFMVEFDDERIQWQALQFAIPAWTANDSDRAVPYILALTGKHAVRPETILPALTAALTTAPNERILAWSDELQDASFRNQFLAQAALSKASASPQDAVKIADSLAVGAVKNAAYRSIASAWSMADATTVSSWIKSIEDGPERDYAALGVATHLVSLDTGAATALLSSITDDAVAAQAATAIYRRLSSTDPQNAETWLAGLDRIPAAMKDQLLATP